MLSEIAYNRLIISLPRFKLGEVQNLCPILLQNKYPEKQTVVWKLHMPFLWYAYMLSYTLMHTLGLEWLPPKKD